MHGFHSGPCPYGPPMRNRWMHVGLEVRGSKANLFLDGVHVATIRGQFPTRGHAGVLLAQHKDNVVHFKGFNITALDPFPFSSKSCNAIVKHPDFHSVIIGDNLWPGAMCRVSMPDNLGNNEYILDVKLFSEAGWTGDKAALPGVMFNAKDINNFDFIYLR